MVTHYDRGECDCTHCGGLSMSDQMVAVEWWEFVVCKKCVAWYDKQDPKPTGRGYTQVKHNS